MSVRSGPTAGVLIMPDTVEELVTDPAWLATCDQVRAALHRKWLPSCRGARRDRLGLITGGVQ